MRWSQFIDLVGFHYDFIYLQRTGEFGVTIEPLANKIIASGSFSRSS